MKIDLHTHPSFFNPEVGFRFTELKQPQLKQIRNHMSKKGLDVIAITSCSNAEHIDPRWDYYLKQAENSDFEKRFLFNRPIKFKPNKNIIEITEYIVMDDLIIPQQKPKKRTIVYGQEIKTDKGDVNILFTDSRILTEKFPSKTKYPLCDFNNIIDCANDSGENVLVSIPHPYRQINSGQITEKEIENLYSKNKIHFLEAFDAMDFRKNNNKSKDLASKLNIPGIAVSDAHRLTDIGKAGIEINKWSSPYDKEKPIEQEIKNAIITGKYENFENYASPLSKALYVARLLEEVKGKPIRKLLHIK